ncbi:MAG TPA: EfeM/EfeO family lipoprotein [Solirubrobacteraceae bacterium]|nr:EfeM/EfeO family lipoprotein [Solirubrobacteraceae bacterium]
MAGTNPTAVGAARSRVRTAVTILALALAASVAAAAAPLLGGSGAFSVRAVNPHARHGDALGVRIRHVYGSNIPAKLYGREIADLEDQGTNLKGQLISDLPPLSPSAFDAPIARYRAYAEAWSRVTAARVGKLEAALRAGSRDGARRAWALAWSAYLHLGAVYGMIGRLDGEIDGHPGEVGDAPAGFGGFHRIEMGLWSGAPLQSVEPYARRLAADVAELPRAVAGAKITPLDYALRSHEILEDAQRDLMSGLEVPWSGEGVLGTAAGIAATREVVGTLASVLKPRDSAYYASEDELALLASAFAQVRDEHGGSWPTLGELSDSQRELLDGRLAGALGALQMLPGALETKTVAGFPPEP